MRALLDINVLIALLDESHQHHAPAKEWLVRNIDAGWASCPITQNGFVRILSQSAYPRPVPVAQAMVLLENAAATAHHEFWADDISFLGGAGIDRTRIHGARQVTDAYLLALAVRHGGRLVTFDNGIPLSVVSGAVPRHLVVL